uniref:O-acyltransferase WSD1 C-terminal domain-containing protein n=1 Tax=Strigamia maritima TaxID=126957 RepID=T1J8F6_STRMM
MNNSTLKNIFNSLVMIVFQLICILFLAISFTILPIFSIYRYLVGMYLQRKYNCPIEFLHGMDAVFCFNDKNIPFNIEGCHIYKGTYNIDQLRQRFERILNIREIDGRWKYMRFRQQMKKELGYFFCIPQTEFRYENHIKEYDGPPLKNKDELQQLIAWQYRNLPVDKGIFWQVILVPLSDTFITDTPQPQHMVFFSVAHAVMDGISILRIYGKLFDDEADESLFLFGTISPPGVMEQMFFWKNAFLYGFAEYFLHILKVEKHCLHGMPLSGDMLISISESICIKRVKEIKNFYKTTTNDVLQSCIVGALRKYIISEGQQIPSLMKFKIPVSLHSMQKEVKIENNISAGTIEVPIDEATCVGRLMKTKAVIDKLKRSPDIYLTHFLGKVFINRFPLMLTLVLAKRASSTATVSCMPLVPSKKLFGNEALQQYIGTGTPDGVSGCGMSVTIISERETALCTIKADLAIVKTQENVNKINHFLLEEIDELYQSIYK